MGARDKPLGHKSYGSIPHLPGSRRGPRDKGLSEQQASILTHSTRDRHDRVIVQEKLDGSNVGAARIGDEIVALSRAGYTAWSSPFEQHHVWARWVAANSGRFMAVLDDGERLCGEWLYQAHGTRYDLDHEPFVVFDIMRGTKRAPLDEITQRLTGEFVTPHILHVGSALSVAAADNLLGEFGHHGATERAEGCVWRVERNRRSGNGRRWVVDFLGKYVRHGKVDGRYLESETGRDPVLNVTTDWTPKADQ